MKVKDLIAQLLELDGEMDVIVDTGELDGGCETCGYGAVQITKDLDEVLDMETYITLTCS